VIAIVVPERSFTDAFRQAEYDFNKAIHDADDRADASPTARRAVASANIQSALNRLKDRLIATKL
jgi:hypothetical protein